MNFEFSSSAQALFADVENAIAQWLKEYGTKSLAAGKESLSKAVSALHRTGYTGLGILENTEIEGGAAMMKAMETAASACPSLFLAMEMASKIPANLISEYGNEAQKSKYLEDLLTGKTIGAVALSEDAMNIENEPFKTRGIQTGNQVEVTGKKSFVINAGIAGLFAVAGIMNDKPAVFLIEKGTPGLIVLDAHPTMGYEDIGISGVEIAHCTISEDQVLRPAQDGQFPDTLRLRENLVLIGASLGHMKNCFEQSKAYSHTHITGGKPLIAYQLPAFKIAEILTLYQSAQLLAYRVAWMAEEKDRETRVVALCAKVFCTEACEKAASLALSVVGGEAYKTGNPIESAYRAAKFAEIAGTSCEIARVKIGDHAMGGPV